MAIRITMTDGRTITGTIESIEEVASNEVQVGDTVRVTEVAWADSASIGATGTLVKIDGDDPKYLIDRDGYSGHYWAQGIERV